MGGSAKGGLKLEEKADPEQKGIIRDEEIETDYR